MLFRLFSKKIRIKVANPKQRLVVEIPKKNYLLREDFTKLSGSYLNKLYSSFESIKLDNPTSRLAQTAGQFTFTKDDFEVTINLDVTGQNIVLILPDGMYTYFYDADNERWVSNNDGHLLEDMLVRETIKKCRGYFTI